MKLRPATTSDSKTIACLHAESWRKNYANDLSINYLENIALNDRLLLWDQRLSAPKPNQQVYVAEADRQIMGFANVYIDENPQWGSYLDNLHVSERYQKKGVGRALLTEVFRWCGAKAKSKSLCLLVNQTNLKAQRFYITNGARNQEPSVWNAPDGSAVPTYWFVWDDVSI